MIDGERARAREGGADVARGGTGEGAGAGAGKASRTARLASAGRPAGATAVAPGAASPLAGVDLGEPYSFHLDQGAGGAGGAPPGPQPPVGLPDGVDYQHVAGTLSFRVRAAWLAQGDARAHNLELLRYLRDHGPLAWATDAQLAAAAAATRLSPEDGDAAVSRVTFTARVYAFVGLPPDVDVAVSGRGQGLSIALRAPGIDVPPGTVLPMSPAQVAAMARALEAFTGLTVRAEVRPRLVTVELDARGGPGVLVHDLAPGDLAALFGREAFERWADDHRGGEGDAGPRAVGRAATNLSSDELARARAWLAAHLPASAVDGAIVDRLLLSVIDEIEASPFRAQILAALNAPGRERAVDARGLRSLVNAAVFEAQAASADVPLPAGEGTLSPVWQRPAPARVEQLAGRVVSGERVPFRIAIDVPAELLTPERQDELRLRPFATSVEWVFERVDGAHGGDRLVDAGLGRTHGARVVLHHRYTGDDAAPVSMAFMLTGNERAAIWRATAFVRHSHFEPTVVSTELEVRAEADLVNELEQRAAGDMGVADAPSTDHDFDTGALNNTFGRDGTDLGTAFYGQLPADFQARSAEERASDREREMADYRSLIAYLRDNDRGSGNQTAIAAAQRQLADLERADRAIARDADAGWRPFELRGTFVSRAPGVADGELQLYGSVQHLFGNVAIQIRDLSRRFDADDRRITGAGATFEAALEDAFVTLCKAYPGGTVFVMAQVHDDHELAATSRTVGFELETGSVGKDMKTTVFDPAVNLAVNLAGMAAMIFVPGSAAVVMPALGAYNTTQTVDQLYGAWIEGTLTTRKLTLGLTSIGLDLLPYLGRVKAVAGSRRGLMLFEGLDLGSEALYMTAGALEQARALQEHHVRAMAGLYRRIVELQRSGNPSDPRLLALLAEFEQEAEKVRRATTTAFAEVGAKRVMFVAAKQLASVANAARGFDVGGAVGTVGDEGGAQTRADGEQGVDVAHDRRARPAAAGGFEVDAADLHGLHAEVAAGDRSTTPIEVDAAAGRAGFDTRGPERRIRIQATLPPAITTGAGLASHANRIVGRPLASIHDGHDLLRAANRGDLRALGRLGVEVPADLRLEGIEFGLGQLPDGRFVVVRGERDAVDWTSLPGVVPVAHTHPLTAGGNDPKVVGEDEIALVGTIAATRDPLVAREIVYPSAADIAMLAERGVREHVVITNLVVRDGAVAAPQPAGGDPPRLEWHILDPVRVGTDPVLGQVYKAQLIADAGGRPVLQRDVWANHTADGPGNLYMTSPLRAPGPAEPAPVTAAQQGQVAARQAELAPVVAASAGRAGQRAELTVLTADAFAARFRSERGRAVFVLEDGQPRVYARVDATADDVVHEVDHARQLDDGPMAPEIRRLHAGGLDEWDQRSVRDRLELFRTKLAIELDAAQRQVDEAAGGADAEATLAARATLANLRGLEREVEGLTDVEVSEMSAGRREEPAYLRDPAWLFAKQRVVVGTRPGRYAVLDGAPRVVLPRTGRDRSPAWDSRADVIGVYRVGDEWREVVLVSSDHAGSVTVRDDGADGQTLVVTDAGGARHPYVLEPGAELLVEDGARVAPGTGLANERNRRYRRVEVEHAAGKDTREEVHAAHGIWMQRGSESTRRGAIMEEAARRQVDARLAAAGIAPVGDGQALGYRRITHGRGGGGFDDVVVIFSGSPEAPEAFIRIREVKDYPNRYVPLEEFSAIRPPNLQKNLRVISKGAEDGMAAITNGTPIAAPLEGLSLAQLGAIRRAVDRNQVRIEVVVGPTTKVGAESGRGASVMSVLRQEIRAASGDVDVLAPELDRVETPFADAAAAASERQGR